MFDGELNLKDYKDEYKEELRKIIDARVAGEEYVRRGSRGAAHQRRRPDGRAAQEPRRRERVEEEAGEGGADGEEGGGEGGAEAQAGLTDVADVGRNLVGADTWAASSALRGR